MSSYIITLASSERRIRKSIWLIFKESTGCGSAWLERLIWDQEVAGSNPVTPTQNSLKPYAGVVQW